MNCLSLYIRILCYSYSKIMYKEKTCFHLIIPLIDQ